MGASEPLLSVAEAREKLKKKLAVPASTMTDEEVAARKELLRRQLSGEV